jgi:acyl carrier protein
MTPVTLRERLAEMVAAASDGEVPADEALGDGASLRALGLSSLGYLRLIDAIESEFGVDVDLAGDPASLDTLDGIAGQLAARGVPVVPS